LSNSARSASCSAPRPTPSCGGSTPPTTTTPPATPPPPPGSPPKTTSAARTPRPPSARCTSWDATPTSTATGTLTISWAKEIAGWTGRIDHEELQQKADQILVEAAAAGADLDDLKLLAQAAYEAWRELEPDPDYDPRGRGFADRDLHLDITLDEAGRIGGDLTPECAAAVTAVLEALGKNRGPQDLRSAGQRYHDALQEACAPQPRASGSLVRLDSRICTSFGTLLIWLVTR
jgi:hypothetical protein